MSDREVARRALVVSYHVPGPDRDSGARRVFNLVEFLLEDGWDVRLLAADGHEEAAAARRLQLRGVAVHDGTREALHDVLSSFRPDLFLVAFWRNLERYLPTIRTICPEAHVIVDSVDVHFLRESRRVFAKSNSVWLGLGATQSEEFAREVNAYAGSDGVLAVSEREASLVGDLLRDGSIASVVPDYEAIAPSEVPFAERRGIAFIGSFQHPPNVEAATFFHREVLPKIDDGILDEHPVQIIGNALGPDIRHLGAGNPAVQMIGWVPMIEPYLSRARISIVPLLHGAGTKRKLIQALAIGTPTVSTSVGVEGLGLVPDEDVLVADDPASFADAIERLVSDEELWQRLSTAGRARITRTHDRESVRVAFFAAVDKAMSRSPASIVPIGPLPTGPAEAQGIPPSIVSLLPRGAHVGIVTNREHSEHDLPGRQAWSIPVDAAVGDSHDARGGDLSHQLSQTSHVLIPVGVGRQLEHNPGLVRLLDSRFSAVRQDGPWLLLRAPTQNLVRLIAFYLPQFHPIPENDEWWGRGFTEWSNVARARPLFDGHYQPHVPGRFGFYDLRLADARLEQAEVARAHGIHGFCYYHYWFEGHRLLERPFDEVLASGDPDFPFCLCWVNESWSRRWDGREDDLLIRQSYSEQDDREHIRSLLPALSDSRAITFDGKPLFLVWRAQRLPDAARTTDIWREEVERAGLPGIHLVAMETAWDLGQEVSHLGFDAKVLFQPQFGWLMTTATKKGARIQVPDAPDVEVYDYDAVRSALDDLEPVAYRRYESVFPSWDNTPRKGERAVIIHGSTPDAYERWLREAVGRARAVPSNDRFVFINAWNEWAEGCHLEPDLRHGRAYLEATRNAVSGAGEPNFAAAQRVPR